MLFLHELAAASGISKPYLSLMESGRCPPPSAEKIRKLDEVLKANGELIRVALIQQAPEEFRALLRWVDSTEWSAFPMPPDVRALVKTFCRIMTTAAARMNERSNLIERNAT